MKAITKAILSVMKSVKGMEKNSKVGKGQYSYNGTSDADVKEVIGAAMQKAGLAILPIDVQEDSELTRWNENGRSRQQIFTKVKVRYLLLHDSGESIEVMGYGHGTDAQDKAAGKAQTYALKTLLLYMFLTPVRKMDDAESTHSNDIAVPAVSFGKSTLPVEKFSESAKWIKEGNGWTAIESKYIVTANAKKTIIGMSNNIESI